MASRHWAKKQRDTRTLRASTKIVARAARVPKLERVRIELHYVPRDERRRDPLNISPTLKACEDGIVDAGVIPDDTPRWSEPNAPVIDPADAKARVRLYLLVFELEPLPVGL